MLSRFSLDYRYASLGHILLVIYVISVAAGGAAAQGEDGAEKDLGWLNETELSLVVTEGNSNTDTFGLKNVLTRAWERSKFVLKTDGVRSNTSDDRFLLVEPGLTFLPGEQPTFQATSIVTPAKEPDVEKYFIEGRYSRSLGGKRTWNAGGSWDRNEDAGILSRFIGFGGVGNVWRDGDKLQFETGYGVSYTDREEEAPDPEKEEKFVGARLTLEVDYLIVKSTRLSYELTGNVNLEDARDYSLDSLGSVAVKMTDRLSLAVSLQFLFNSEPALEDVDILARVELVDPDGVPGSGDEFFITVDSGGSEVEVGEDRIRLDSLDTVFRTSLIINF